MYAQKFSIVGIAQPRDQRLGSVLTGMYDGELHDLFNRLGSARVRLGIDFQLVS